MTDHFSNYWKAVVETFKNEEKVYFKILIIRLLVMKLSMSLLQEIYITIHLLCFQELLKD